MKKQVLRSSFLAGVLSLFLFFAPVKASALTDITKPYLGEYECKSATYGKKDVTNDFSYIVLELKEDGTFVLRYADKKNKKKGEETGTYVYDEEKQTVRFALNGKSEIQRDFPLENGELFVAVKMGFRTFTIRFEQK